MLTGHDNHVSGADNEMYVRDLLMSRAENYFSHIEHQMFSMVANALCTADVKTSDGTIGRGLHRSLPTHVASRVSAMANNSSVTASVFQISRPWPVSDTSPPV